MKSPLLSLLLVGLLAIVGCADDQGAVPTAPADAGFESQFPVNETFEGRETRFAAKTTATGDLVATAEAAGFKTLVAAVRVAGLESTLREGGPFTVFAPTDAAFEKLPDGLVEQLLLPENQDKLQQLLLYHVVEGAVTSRDLGFFQRVETVEGSELNILRFFRLVLVNGIPVTLADVLATNGVIHVIDEVLVPEGFTLEDPAEPTLDLVDTAAGAGLTRLVSAARAAGLEGALREQGPLTVFAPTNAAFEALPEGLVDELLLPENVGLLQELLLYHVTEGQILSTDLRRFQFVDMLAGGYTFVYKTWGGDLRVNFSKVTAADVLATNGVAHVIDRVLIPSSFYGLLDSLPREAPQLGPEMMEAR